MKLCRFFSPSCIYMWRHYHLSLWWSMWKSLLGSLSPCQSYYYYTACVSYSYTHLVIKKPLWTVLYTDSRTKDEVSSQQLSWTFSPFSWAHQSFSGLLIKVKMIKHIKLCCVLDLFPLQIPQRKVYFYALLIIQPKTYCYRSRKVNSKTIITLHLYYKLW